MHEAKHYFWNFENWFTNKIYKNGFLKKQPPEAFYDKSILRSFPNSQENTCARVSF